LNVHSPDQTGEIAWSGIGAVVFASSGSPSVCLHDEGCASSKTTLCGPLPSSPVYVKVAFSPGLIVTVESAGPEPLAST
jgi:hypothetical protein